jgi:hypothetical protein
MSHYILQAPAHALATVDAVIYAKLYSSYLHTISLVLKHDASQSPDPKASGKKPPRRPNPAPPAADSSKPEETDFDRTAETSSDREESAVHPPPTTLSALNEAKTAKLNAETALLRAQTENLMNKTSLSTMEVVEENQKAGALIQDAEGKTRVLVDKVTIRRKMDVTSVEAASAPNHSSGMVPYSFVPQPAGFAQPRQTEHAPNPVLRTYEETQHSIQCFQCECIFRSPRAFKANSPPRFCTQGCLKIYQSSSTRPDKNHLLYRLDQTPVDD